MARPAPLDDERALQGAAEGIEKLLSGGSQATGTAVTQRRAAPAAAPATEPIRPRPPVERAGVAFLDEPDPEEEPEDAPEPDPDNAGVEGEDEEAAEGEGDEEPAEGEGEEQPLKTIEDIARQFGASAIDLARQIEIPGHVPGQSITLHDLLEAHRRAPEAADIATRLRSHELDLVRRERDVQEAVDQRLGDLQAHMERLVAALDADGAQMTDADWMRLRSEDPVRYNTMRQDIRDREDLLRQGVALRERERQKRDTQTAEQRRQLADQEYQKLLTARPEWRDPAKAKADGERMLAMLNDVGLDLASWHHSTIDHRMTLVADMAALYWEQQKKKPALLRRVAKLPQVARPAARVDRPAPTQKDALDRSIRRHRRLGTVESAASIIEGIL